MLENVWGGCIYIFVSVVFFTVAIGALYFLYEILWVLREILDVLNEINE